jgi:hypothetical protein
VIKKLTGIVKLGKFVYMRKIPQFSSLWFLFLSYFLFGSCEKQGRYDLFPLKVGNEFYYRYYNDRILSSTIGTEAWKVISEESQGSSVKYIIERKLNAILSVLNDTIIISDSTRYFEVIEERSSSLISVFGYSFKRFQDVSQIELKNTRNTSTPITTYVFKADSGMTSYHYYHPPNQISNETLRLDSLKIY